MRLPLGFLLSVLITAPAAAEASFDCNKSKTAVEKAICDDGNPGLGFRDIVLSNLFAAMKQEGSHTAILKQQSAWLRERNACGANPECLSTAYDARIAELAEASGDDLALTGTYAYAESADTDFGEIFVARMPDSTLFGRISTVSGPTYHTCELEFAGAQPEGNDVNWTWLDPEETPDGEHCSISFVRHDRSLVISSTNCSNYCGARGYFDQTYSRAK